MTTLERFDIDSIRRFTDGLKTDLDSCDHGEGSQCATLDNWLAHYALACCHFCEQVNERGRAIFEGRADPDQQAEQILRQYGYELYVRARDTYWQGKQSEGECFSLSAVDKLKLALQRLERLVAFWIPAAPSVGPGRRTHIDKNAIDEIQKKIAQLPPLPKDWEPADARQKMIFQKLSPPARP